MIFFNKYLQAPLLVRERIDKSDKRLVAITYIPSEWAASTVYVVGDIVLPTAYKGLCFEVIGAGKSSVTEPVWPTETGKTVTNGAIFKAIDYPMINQARTITVSTFTASDSVTLTAPTNTTKTTGIMISTIPNGVNSFTVTNHITLDNSEEFDFSLRFHVVEK